MLKLKSAARTDTGHTRESNQDRTFAKIDSICGLSCGLFCVADGMGGLSDGHYAATVAVESIERWWYDRLKLLIESGNYEKNREISNELITLFSEINESILNYANERNTKLGTTCSLLLICDNRYYVAHTGDSRIYQMQKKRFRKKELFVLTEDHNWLVDQMKLGFLPVDEIQKHPNRNKLTGGLGVFERPRVSTCSEVLDGSGIFVLCSDGLYRVVDNKELGRITAGFNRCDNLADKLIGKVLTRGAPDNVSVVTISYSV
jgi:protein phosphatase